MTKKIKRYICWDFDRTLGLFNKPDETSDESDNENELVGSRFGMRETLSSLLGRGYRHIITTANDTSYPSKMLDRTDFDQYFNNIFGMWEILGSHSKDYDVVRRWAKWTKKKAMESMVAVGDNFQELDIPYNLPILFINQDYGYRYDAKVVDLILQRFEQENPKDLSDAFRKLSPRKTCEFQGVSFSMEYKENHGILVPMISGIVAESYRRPVVPLDD